MSGDRPAEARSTESERVDLELVRPLLELLSDAETDDLRVAIARTISAVPLSDEARDAAVSPLQELFGAVPAIRRDPAAMIGLVNIGALASLDDLLAEICSDSPPALFRSAGSELFVRLALLPQLRESACTKLLERLDDPELCTRGKMFIRFLVASEGEPVREQPSQSGWDEIVIAPPRIGDRPGANAVAQLLIEQPFDPIGGLTVSGAGLRALESVHGDLARNVAQTVVAEAGRLSSPETFERFSLDATQVLGHLPPDEIPLGEIYTLTQEVPEPVLADDHLKWVMARSGPALALREFAPRMRQVSSPFTQIEMLDLIAASAAPATPEPPRSPGAIGVDVATAIRGGGTVPTPQTPPIEGLETSDAIQPDPRTAWPHLLCPNEVVAGEDFILEVGLRADQLARVGGTGLLTLPAGSFDLDVEINIDGFEIRGGTPRFTLSVTDADPYPVARITLAPRRAADLQEVRTIGATFFVRGSMCGYAYRLVRVAASAVEIGRAQVPQAPWPPGFDAGDLPESEEVDLTVVIWHGDDLARSTLRWTARSPRFDVELPAEAPKSDIGDAPAQFARAIVDYCSTATNPVALMDYLIGRGRTIAKNIPPEIRKALQDAARICEGRPPRILIVSSDPYVPWELAVLEEGAFGRDRNTSPFLGGRAALGRWPLSGDRPPPRPPGSMNVADRAVIAGVYNQVPNWPRLKDAEAEAAEFEKRWASAQRVDATYTAVREALRSKPPVDLLHFALHGQLADSAQNGLVLIGSNEKGQPIPEFMQPSQVSAAGFDDRTPFIFLNACQLGGGASVLGDYAGMAAALLEIGASSVVAPLWSINDKVAHKAAGDFYERALDSPSGDVEPIAEVLRSARAAFTEKSVDDGEGLGVSTYLAYQYFGHPNLRLRS